jgi:hypothetical protein
MTLLLLASLALAGSFNSNGGKVELPWNDFNTLYTKYVLDQQKAPASPRDWTIDRAVFTGTVVGEGDDAYAIVKMNLRGAVHKKEGWSTVPLLGASTALRSATIGGKDAPLFVQSGYYTFITDKPGAFEANLEFAVKLFEADGEKGFTLPLPAAGATVVGLAVKSADELQFEVPGAQGLNVTNVGTERRLEAYVPSMASLTVSWSRKVKEQTADEKKRETRVYAEARTLIGVSEGVLSGRADIDYTVLHNPVERFKVNLPADATVLEVRGNGIRTWTQAKDGSIDVELNYAAEGLYRLGIDYERTLESGMNLPLVRLSGVTRETDYVGVDARSAVELVAKSATGAVPIDVRELPAALTGQTDYPVLLAYRARGGEVQIPLEVRQHPDMDMLVTLVDTAAAETLVTEDGRRMTRIRYGVRNNRKQFLNVKVPDGAEVWSASVAGRGVKVARGEKGDVLVPLVRSDASGGALTAFLVELVYVEEGTELANGRGAMEVHLPTVDAPSSILQWTVYIPATATIVPRTSKGSVRRVDWFSAAPVLPAEAVVTQKASKAVRAEVQHQGDNGALGQGVEPVEVQLPLSGNAYTFEKTLVLDEALWVGFDYKHKVKVK